MPEINDEDFQMLHQYKQLGLVDDIKTQLIDYRKLQRATAVEDAAQNVGYNPRALDKLLGDLSVITKEVNGEKKSFVLQDDQEIDLAEYASENWAEFMPSLTTTNAADKDNKKTGYIPQHFSSGKKKEVPSIVQQYIQRTYQYED